MRRKFDLGDFVLPDVDPRAEIGWTLAAIGAAVIWSLGGPARISREWSQVESALEYGMKLEEPVFPTVLGTSLYGFAVVAAGLVVLMAWHYVSLRRGSRADYLMGRLPDRWEVHRRCLTIPAAGLILTAAAAAILFFTYRAYYFHRRGAAYRVMEKILGGDWNA